jgi:acetyl esterase/lipase
MPKENLPMSIDRDGTVRFGSRVIPVPKSLSPEAKQYLMTPPWGDTLPNFDGQVPAWEIRAKVDAGLKELAAAARAVYPVAISEKTIGGVRCDLVTPPKVPDDNKSKVLINLHGGAFVLGSGSLIEAIPVAHQAKISVVAVDYRLAPEHPFPAAVEDSVAVYRELLETHEPRNIAIYGTSAGGILTAQTAAKLIQLGLPMPACLGMFTGTADMEDFGETANVFSVGGYWGDVAPPMDHPSSELGAYRGKHDVRDPVMSPIHSDLSKFPPSLIITGTRDAMLSATSIFHRALRRAGAKAELFVFEGMPHAHWYAFHLPESREAVDIMARFFTENLGR